MTNNHTKELSKEEYTPKLFVKENTMNTNSSSSSTNYAKLVVKFTTIFHIQMIPTKTADSPIYAMKQHILIGL